MDYFNSRLPVEITVDILSKLPTESVLDSKLNHDDGDEESTTPIKRIKFTSPVRNRGNIIAGSCNGLVCLVCNQDVCVFNPITREFVILPKVKTGCGDVYRYNFGFGYASSTNEYKVLVILVKKTKAEEIYVYTLGSRREWRNLGNLDFEFEACNWSEPGVFANGAIYWMMGDKCKMIVTFDLVAEKFCKHLSPPPLPPESIWRYNSIAAFQWSFAVFCLSICL
ncbi:putative F-box protein At4g21240 [Papaver somniferum]|uniref:putative F-box protein At4g21240 n=1 Tax=Papaver somniferum TaxID=3469 RepID=UPI000E6F9E31|nr:putative F-box protein At4g21240 [Papaver somniferum]